MKNTVVLVCTCRHAGQDTVHGAGRRVFNRTGKFQKKDTYRCTVCKSLVEYRGSGK